MKESKERFAGEGWELNLDDFTLDDQEIELEAFKLNHSFSAPFASILTLEVCSCCKATLV